MSTFASNIEQIISQVGTMNSSSTVAAPNGGALLDLNTLFETFDDSTQYHSQYSVQPPTMVKSSTNTTTDDLMHSLLYSNHSSLASSSTSSSSLLQQQYSPMINTPCLDAFTPAVGFMTDSPMMTTPYMDPLIGSHFSTPMISYNDDSTSNTIDTSAVTEHLDQYFASTIDSTINSVDPSHLALEQPNMALTQLHQNDNNNNNNNNNNNDDDDSLFPPLSHEQQQATSLTSCSGNDLDLFFDDLFNTNDIFPSNQVQQPLTSKLDSDTENKKRKRSDLEDDKLNSIEPAELDRMIKHAKINDNHQFLCDLCQRGFSRRYNLGTHIKTHYKARARPFPCHLCTKSFDRKHDCLRHISTVHKGERLHTCHDCSISFSRRDALHRHQAQKHAN